MHQDELAASKQLLQCPSAPSTSRNSMEDAKDNTLAVGDTQSQPEPPSRLQQQRKPSFQKLRTGSFSFFGKKSKEHGDHGNHASEPTTPVFPDAEIAETPSLLDEPPILPDLDLQSTSTFRFSFINDTISRNNRARSGSLQRLKNLAFGQASSTQEDAHAMEEPNSSEQPSTCAVPSVQEPSPVVESEQGDMSPEPNLLVPTEPPVIKRRASFSAALVQALNPLRSSYASRPSVSSGDASPQVVEKDVLEVLHDNEKVASSEKRKRSSSLALLSGANPLSFGRRRGASIIPPIIHTPAAARDSTDDETSHSDYLGVEGSRASSSSECTSYSQLSFAVPDKYLSSVASSTTSTGQNPNLLSPHLSSDSPDTCGSSISAEPPMLKKIPPAEMDETPETYVARLQEICAKTEIARVLASSTDPFHTQALQSWIGSFDFSGLPIDIALRKLLMKLFLPKETQQIDRVIEAFSEHYHKQNPLFQSADQAYLLAFSMIMLHTDAFNKSNKKKMSRADYVRNTMVDGLMPEVLEYIYDNTTYTPYVFVDGDMSNRGQSFESEASSMLSTPASTPVTPHKNKIDVYKLISEQQLRSLRPSEVEARIPFKNPFSYSGTFPFFSSRDLNAAYASAPIIQVPVQSVNSHKRQTESGLPGLSIASAQSDVVAMGVAKAGLLLRKDDLLEGGKRASSRKWKETSVLLTESYLFFFKDPVWAQALGLQIDNAGRQGLSRPMLSLPPGKPFKPDAVLSLKGQVAIYDFSFTKKANCFALVAADGHQTWFQAQDNTEMNDWISLINYAAAFKTNGIHMRSSDGPVSFLPSVQSNQHKNNTTRLVRSTQGQIVGRTLVTSDDEHWEDDHVFEQFSQFDALAHSNSKVVTSRADILKIKIGQLQAQVASKKALLQAQLCKARHLAILRPFAATTRQRIHAIVPDLAKSIRHLRIELCRHVLGREVLAVELAAEERTLRHAQSSTLSSTKRPRAMSHIESPQKSAWTDLMQLSFSQPSSPTEPVLRPRLLSASASASAAASTGFIL